MRKHPDPDTPEVSAAVVEDEDATETSIGQPTTSQNASGSNFERSRSGNPPTAEDESGEEGKADATDHFEDELKAVYGEEKQFVQQSNQYATSSQRGTTAEIPDENNISEVASATTEIPLENTGSGQLKTPEDGYASDTYGEENQSVQQISVDVTLSRHGTIAEEIPNENTNAGQKDSAVLNDDEDSSIVLPGFMFVAGPDYTGTGIHTGYISDPDDDGDINERSLIVEGFLPEDDPSQRQRMPRSETIEERVQRLIDNAITLDDSAVRPIPMEEDGDEEENNNLEASQSNQTGNDDEVEKSDSRCRLLSLLGLALATCIILAVALPLSMRGRSENAAQDTTVSLSDAVCLPGEVDVRFELAKSILSSITSLDLLEDESTPQGKAIQWIVCDDSISVQLLDNQDPSTGKLPKQKLGFRLSGDSGEAQVTRRYILAVFSFSTSQVNPWKDSLNFMSPDLHECNWYKNYTRDNFPYGDIDPVGVFCTDGLFSPFHREDQDNRFDNMVFNFRVDHDLNGPLPPEIGYLMDCRSLMIENQLSLTGQLPQTMGNMTQLFNVGLLLNGPKFGGELPSSLFRLKKLNTIHVQYNFGMNWSLPSNVEDIEDTQLERIVLVNSFVGTIPSWVAELKQLQTLDLSRNSFQGAIPEAIGDLSSLKYLNLMENNLTETIPSSIGNLTAIEVLNLGNNALQGELPASIGNLRTLQLLDVGSNAMTSTIPSSFGDLESLKYLVLESNRFNGTVDVLESMQNLTVLQIRSNSFSGSLPDGLFSGTSDNVIVDVGNNKFTDGLPASFANSFADSATSEAVCDNTTLLVMDCDACECCEVCCDGENDAVCDFQLDVPTVLGYACGSWFVVCMQGKDDFAQVIG